MQSSHCFQLYTFFFTTQTLLQCIFQELTLKINRSSKQHLSGLDTLITAYMSVSQSSKVAANNCAAQERHWTHLQHVMWIHMAVEDILIYTSQGFGFQYFVIYYYIYMYIYILNAHILKQKDSSVIPLFDGLFAVCFFPFIFFPILLWWGKATDQ